MKQLIIVAALALALVGCATTGTMGPITPSKCDPVIVKVPTPVAPPAPPTVVRPALAISTLSAADAKNPAKVVKAYKATIKSLEGYAEQLEIILDGYRTAAVQFTVPTVEPVLYPVSGTTAAAAAAPAGSGTAQPVVGSK